MKIRIENTDRPIGFLLSGGLDSSLVAAVAKSLLPEGTRLRTFSIGTESSPDIQAARVVAKYLDTDHTEVPFDIEEGLAVIPDVIKSLESYDTTTVRASVPMWLLCKWISQNTECRVIISGEGSDELFGGYLYFHYAPDVQHFYLENIRRLRLIHQFDGLRADRCIAAHGLELRVPFLDKEFVEVGMTIDQRLKVPGDRMEKWILREAFEGYLPNEILWRQKNGMSDAVGYSWVDAVKKAAEGIITDEKFSNVKYVSGTHNSPLTKEEAMYRNYFWKEFGYGRDHLISEIWRPRWTTETDPSAAKLSVHQDNSAVGA
jgi:asparagine synthase (glutamine-hydrolysing)